MIFFEKFYSKFNAETFFKLILGCSILKLKNLYSNF